MFQSIYNSALIDGISRRGLFRITWEKEFQPTNFDGAPNTLLSLAAIKSQSQTCASPAFSSFLGSPSPSSLPVVHCSSSQIYAPQTEHEELAFWQSLQKQPINLDQPESQHFQLPQQHLKSMAPPESYHCQLPQQHLRFIKPPESFLSQLPQQHLKFMEPPESHHSQLPQQPLGFIDPSLKSSHKQHTDMDPTRSQPSQLKQPHFNFIEHPLKRGDQISQCVLQATSTTPLESQSQRLLLAPVTINQEKSACKQVQDVNQKPRLVASFSVPRRDPFTGKGKSLMPPISQLVGVELSGNRGNLNAVHSISPVLDHGHHSLPPRGDIRRQKEDYSGLSALIEFVQALQACSPPGSDIPDPYRETAGPLFDIPFFRKSTGSSGTTGSPGNLRHLPLAYDAKDSHSRKGKQVVNKRRRK